MKPFRVCPRCDCWHIFKCSSCSRCSFAIVSMLYATIDWKYMFDTDKYKVKVYGGQSLVASKATRRIYAMAANPNNKTGIGIDFPIIDVVIPKQLSPKTTDQDIEKYLLLLG